MGGGENLITAYRYSGEACGSEKWREDSRNEGYTENLAAKKEEKYIWKDDRELSKHDSQNEDRNGKIENVDVKEKEKDVKDDGELKKHEENGEKKGFQDAEKKAKDKKEEENEVEEKEKKKEKKKSKEKKKKKKKKKEKEGKDDPEKLKKKLSKFDEKLEKILLKKEDCLQKLKELEERKLHEREGEASYTNAGTNKSEETEWKPKKEGKKKEKKKKKDKKKDKSGLENLSKKLEGLYDKLGYVLSETQEYLKELKEAESISEQDAASHPPTSYTPKDGKVENLDSNVSDNGPAIQVGQIVYPKFDEERFA